MRAAILGCILLLAVFAVAMKTGDAQQCIRGITPRQIANYACWVMDSQARQFWGKPLEGVCGDDNHCTGIEDGSVELVNFQVRSGCHVQVSRRAGEFRGRIRNGIMKISAFNTGHNVSSKFQANIRFNVPYLIFSAKADNRGCLNFQLKYSYVFSPSEKYITVFPDKASGLAPSAKEIANGLGRQIPSAVKAIAKKLFADLLQG